MRVCVCVCTYIIQCARACVRACMRACVCVCVHSIERDIAEAGIGRWIRQVGKPDWI